MNLASLLDNAALHWPAHPAIRYQDNSISFAALRNAALAFSGELTAHGIGPGDVVALFSLTTPQFAIAYFAVLRLSATVVALNPAMKREGIAAQLQHSGAKALVVDATFLPQPCAAEIFAAAEAHREIVCLAFTSPSAPAPPAQFHSIEPSLHGASGLPQAAVHQTSPDDTAVVLYTSGTTGAPKGAQLTHLNLFLNAILFRDAQRITHDDRVFITVPIAYVIGQTGLMNAAFAAGATIVLNPQFDPPATIALMARERITRMIGPPALYTRLIQAAQENPEALAVLRECWGMAVCGGAPVPLPVWEQIATNFQTKVIVGYGLTETSPIITCTGWDTPRTSQLVGKTILGVEARVMDDAGKPIALGETGELWTRGHHIMKGYLNNDAANAASFHEGWFRTGDLARQDDEGNFYIVGRLKEMIIRSGNKVYPSEIEQVLLEHPAVGMVAVVGVETEGIGEEVVACVVKRGEANESELIDWCKTRVPHYAYPRRICFMEALPVNATGKVVKFELQQQVQSSKP